LPQAKIKAVLFDLGETLLHFGRIKVRRFFREGALLTYEYLKGLGQPVGGFWFYFWRNLLSVRFHYCLSKVSGRDFNTLKLLKNYGLRNGIRLNEQQWRHLAWLWYEPLSKIGQIEPGTKETLRSLKDLGLSLGILSNTFINSSTLERHLGQLEILEFFQVRVYSYEFHFRKPDTRIFRIAAERIGQTPEHILFVGDRLDNDIRPARQVGMRVVVKDAYTNAGKQVPAGVRKVRGLCELPQVIAEINAG